MAQLTKILRNESGSTQTYAGKTLADGESYTISITEWTEWSLNEPVRAAIESGDLVVNDGTTDLSSQDGLNILDKFQPDLANFFNGIDAGVFRTSRVLNLYNTTNSQTITSTPSTIILDTASSISDTSSFIFSSGEIDFLITGQYRITYSVTFDNINTARSNTQSFIEINTGSGFNKVVGSDVYTYERTDNADRQTGSKTVHLEVNKGDFIRVRSQVIQGSNNETVAGGCVIDIEPLVPESSEVILEIDSTDNINDTLLGNLDAGEL